MGKITSSREQLTPDPRFGSLLASKFINCLMVDGKKSIAQKVFYGAMDISIAQKVFYGAMDIVASKINDVEPIEVFNRAIENCKPSVEVRSKRVGGAAYQVPMQVNRNRQQSLGIRWMMQAVREKKGRATHEKLAEEILAAYKREGAAVTKRDNVHRMADANKAFAHFAW
ncbi:MAG: 30S ribosomal protein S7 [Planctomycetia bacterium]|nr:30S ribosomal protein S7 [Planctomycetia bacterium]